MLYRKRAIGTIAYLGGLPALLESFCWAWGQMVQYNSEYLCAPGEVVHYDRAPVSLHDFARNTLVDRMQGDWLLQFDTDHVFDPDITARLLFAARTFDLPVVVGIYRHKVGAGSPVIYQWNADATQALPIGAWDRDARVIEVGTAGGGCLLVRRAVFDRIRAELKQLPFARMDNLGEDHSFFRRCKTLGIPVHVLPRVEAPHLAVRPLEMVDYVPPPMDSLQHHDTGGFA